MVHPRNPSSFSLAVVCVVVVVVAVLTCQASARIGPDAASIRAYPTLWAGSYVSATTQVTAPTSHWYLNDLYTAAMQVRNFRTPSLPGQYIQSTPSTIALLQTNEDAVSNRAIAMLDLGTTSTAGWVQLPSAAFQTALTGDIANAMTMSVWVKPRSSAMTKSIPILSLQSCPGFSFAITSVNGTVSVTVGSFAMQSTLKLIANRWNHVLLTATPIGGSQSTFQLYIDGDADSQLTASTNQLSFGSTSCFLQLNFDGGVDEVEVYSRVIAADEVIRRALAGHSGACNTRPCFPGVDCVPVHSQAYACGTCPPSYTGDGRTCSTTATLRQRFDCLLPASQATNASYCSAACGTRVRCYMCSIGHAAAYQLTARTKCAGAVSNGTLRDFTKGPRFPNVNECSAAVSPCDSNSVCVDTPTSFVCQCKPGYTQTSKTTCADINECATANGGCPSVCVNTPGSYQCTCPAGYTNISNVCTDVNECLSNNGGCNHNCANTIGSYQCSCTSGWSIDPASPLFCRDVNQCATGNGGCSHTCIDLIGGFICRCPLGMTLATNGLTCQDVNECAVTDNNPCQYLCQNTVGSFQCLCLNGSVGNNPTACGVCPSGHICTAGSAPSPCAAGTYLSASVANPSCLACPLGTYSTSASTRCIECPVGYYCPTPSGTPIRCTDPAANQYARGQSTCGYLCPNSTNGFNCPANASTSCDDIMLRNPNAGVLSDGVYTLVIGGTPFPVYCVFLSGKGFEVALNLNSRDTSIRSYGNYSFWLDDDNFNYPIVQTYSTIQSALTKEYKGHAYRVLMPTEMAIMYHDGTGSPSGRSAIAYYNILSQYTGMSLSKMMSTLVDTPITGTRTSNSGSLNLVQNTLRSQSQFGDVFVNFVNPVVINRQSGWGADNNFNRLATTLTNTDYGHTFAGIGGYHTHASMAWGLNYESAPISSYCDIMRGYGAEATHTTGQASIVGTSFPYTSSCRNGAFQWVPVDVAILVRGTTPFVVNNDLNLLSGIGLSSSYPGRSCKEIGSTRTFFGAFANGLYFVYDNNNVIRQTYCVGVGQTAYAVLLNLPSTDSVVRDYTDTAFWLGNTTLSGSVASAMSAEYKQWEATSMPLSSIGIVLHNGAGTILGVAAYELLPTFAGQMTLTGLLGNVVGREITGPRTYGWCRVDIMWNSQRPTQSFGDLFTMNKEPLVLNKQDGWAAAENFNRIATSLTESVYGHTFAGLGGRHQNSGWGLYYESAPISSYCNMMQAYGNSATSNGRAYNSLNYPDQSCGSSSFSTIALHVAVVGNPGPLSEVPFRVPRKFNGLYGEDINVPGTSCEDIRVRRGGGLSNGIFYITSRGITLETYCYFYGGYGYDVVLNLNSSDSTVQSYAASFWTQAYTYGSITNAMSADFRGDAYVGMNNITEFRFVYRNKAGVIVGDAAYDALPYYQNMTVYEMLNSLKSTIISGPRKSGAFRSFSLVRNTDRNLIEFGDSLLDFTLPLMANKQSGWGSDKTLTRLDTNIVPVSVYGHTYSGIGGDHAHNVWGIQFESAPISSYCDLRRAYGSSESSNSASGGYANYPVTTSCRNSVAFSFVDVHITLLARGS